MGQLLCHEPALARVFEPVRTLDAIHLATALLHATEIGSLAVLSIDQSVRANADALGLAVVP
jgi:hypothetical protein